MQKVAYFPIFFTVFFFRKMSFGGFWWLWSLYNKNKWQEAGMVLSREDLKRGTKIRLCSASSFNVNIEVHRVDDGGIVRSPEKQLIYFTTETFIVNYVEIGAKNSVVRMNCKTRRAPPRYYDITSIGLDTDVVTAHFEIIPAGAAVGAAVGAGCRRRAEFNDSTDHIVLNGLIIATVPLHLTPLGDDKTYNMYGVIAKICDISAPFFSITFDAHDTHAATVQLSMYNAHLFRAANQADHRQHPDEMSNQMKSEVRKLEQLQKAQSSVMVQAAEKSILKLCGEHQKQIEEQTAKYEAQLAEQKAKHQSEIKSLQDELYDLNMRLNQVLCNRTQFAAPADTDSVMSQILFHGRHRLHHESQVSALTRIYDKQREEAADADRALKQEARQSAKVGVKRERED